MPGFAASVAFTLAVGVGVGLALFGFADAGLGHDPARVLPSWDRGPDGHGWTERLRTVEEIRHAGVRSLLAVLWGTAALVVASATIIAAARVLARGAARRTAVAMRVVLGAGARRIFGFAMKDAGVPVLLGGALGIAAGLGLGYVARATWPADERWADAAGRAALFGVALPVGVALLCALAPVAVAYRRDLASGLGTGDRATAGRFEGWVRRLLTMAQFTASMALLVAAGTLLRGTLGESAATAPGFDPRDTLTLTVALPAHDAARTAYLRDTLDRVRAIPGVRSAGLVSEDGWTGTGPEDVVTGYCKPSCVVAGLLVPVVPGKVHQFVASDGYFETLRAPMIEGRGFAPGAAWEAVVTRSAASVLFPGVEPIGQHVLPRPEPNLLAAAAPAPRYRVVGVVEDVRPLGPGVTEKVEPAMYLAAPRHPPRVVELVVRTAGDPMRLAGAVARAIGSAAPGARVRDVMTMEERLARFAAPVRWAAAVLAGLAVVGVALACAGLFGVVREGVARRTREIGVRMALGAHPDQVVRHIVGDAMHLARTSLMLGTLAAFATARTLQVFFHGIRPWDPALYLSVAALLTAVALVAAWLPARRAATVDPMVAIRAR
jgi:putative ABC transport system permease protein